MFLKTLIIMVHIDFDFRRFVCCRSASGVYGSEVINHKDKLPLMLDSIINFISSEIFWWLLLDK